MADNGQTDPAGAESRAEIDELRRLLRSLEQRIAALERAMPWAGLRTEDIAEPARPVPPAGAPKPPPLPTIPPPLPVATPAPRRAPHLLGATRARFTTASIENTIGQNWAGWVGAIVFVLGVLFFLKYAWDQGWIRPTPTMRVMAAMITGIATSCIGEWMHRQRVQVLAATLHGAGLAIVLASFFGAYALFDPDERVLGATAAFIGVAVAAALGVGVALHTDSVIVAIIALLGAYLAPFVLNTGEDRSAALLGYLGVLSAVAWGLGWLRPRWPVLRPVAWIGTFGTYFAWMNELGDRHMGLAIGWLAIYYLGFLGEMVLTLVRVERDEIAPALARGLAILSLLNTAAIYAALSYILRDEPQRVMGAAAIGLALLQGAVAFATKQRGFAISSLLQAAALITLAVPLMLDKHAVVLAWLALAVAVAALGWELNVPSGRLWAAVLLLLSIGRLILDPAGRADIELSLGWFSVSRWMLMAWGTAVLSHLIAWMRPRRPGRYPVVEQGFAQRVPAGPVGILNYAAPAPALPQRGLDGLGIGLALLGTAIFLAASMSDYAGSTYTLLALLWLGGIVALVRFGKPLAYGWHAAVLAAALSLKWLFVDGIGPLVDAWDHPQRGEILAPILNLPALNGALLCGILLGLLIEARRQEPRDIALRYMSALGVWIAVVLFALVNFEVCRAVDWIATSGGAGAMPRAPIIKQVAMSVLWAIVGFAAIVAGFARRVALLRYAGLGLLGVTLVKILIVDMAEVKAIWRILSFVAVGALLLGVSYVYHRQVEEKQRRAEAENLHEVEGAE